MPTIAPQTLLNTAADTGLNRIYANSTSSIPVNTGNTVIYITEVQETITEIFTGRASAIGGDNTQVQFNYGGSLSGDSGLTFDRTTGILNVATAVTTHSIYTDNIYYSNAQPWSLSGGSNYSNSNVGAYLVSYTGNISANIITASSFIGTASLASVAEVAQSVAGANVTGSVPNATLAATATNATNADHATVSDSANSVAGVNVTGTVPNANNATYLGGSLYSTYLQATGTGSSLSAINGANVTGTVSSAVSATSATTAGTVTTHAQPNITSVGTLTGLTISGDMTVANISAGNTVTANYFVGSANNLSNIQGSNVYGPVSSATVSATVSASAQPNITSVGTLISINTTGVTSISNATASTNKTTGALTVVGGIASQGNIHSNNMHATTNVYAQGTLYAGNNAEGQGVLTNPVIIGKTTGSTYVQAAVLNSSGTGSADWIAYGDSYPGPSDDHGWADLGFTGSTFNDPTYTITKPNDAYVFGSAIDGSGLGGNLVLCTDYTGTYNDIVFGMGGFGASQEFARMTNSTRNFGVKGSVSVDSFLRLKPTTQPSSPAEGTVYYDGALHGLRLWDGATWRTIALT